ncbi:MAG: DUF1569 domain-containing protein [Terriglobales bacterium]
MDGYLQRALQILEDVTQDITTAELVRHKPGKWSSAEILEHLSRAYSSTSKLMQRHLDSGQPSLDAPTLNEGMMTEKVIEGENFPPGQDAPGFTLPKGISPDDAMPRVRETIAAMDQIIEKCEKAFGADATIAKHAIFGPLTARQWRKFHWVHTAHHAKQIAALRQDVAASGR